MPVATTFRNGTPGPISTTPSDQSNYAAVILAGGDGARLSSFTRKVFGHHLPKQFCPLFAGETLLEWTMRRISLLIPPERTITVLNRAHERFYAPILGTVPSSQLLVEPENRGTAAAVLSVLRRLVAQGHIGPVAIFPSDHYVNDDSSFMRQIADAFRAVEFAPQLTVLLGITPDGPEPEYGWIEPGTLVAPSHPLLGQIRQIRRFKEKPSPEVARELFDAKWLWNSAILVGNVATLLSLIESAVPEIYRKFTWVGSFLDGASEAEVLQTIFRDLPSVDFSLKVLSEFPAEFSVMPITGVMWSDLGDPRRLLAAISSGGGRSPIGTRIFNGQTFAAPGLKQRISKYKTSQHRH